jgi:exodeoxyribonuclease VII large subunit
LRDGAQVVVYGEVSVYEARGQYQLIVRAVIEDGVGKLQREFEALKARLAAEGIFDAEKKRAIPAMPRTVGFITSPTGAAVQDFVRILTRRGWRGRLVVLPAKVQGDGASSELIAMLAVAEELGIFDLLVIGRGGGSLEDLWAFNEEPVARAIYESQIPVVSAVGHEIDFTIADFVADFRAATPSAAAEIITEGVFASREFVADAPFRLQQLARRKLDREIENFDSLAGRFERLHPRRKLDDSLQRLDDLQSGLLRGLETAARSRSLVLENLAGRFWRAKPSLNLKARREAVRQLEKRLNSLGPEQVLARGYSITTDAATGKVLRDAAEVKAGQTLKTRLAKGSIVSRTERED